jgi:ribosomal protein S18 acetylase RimI-like enzyme
MKQLRRIELAPPANAWQMASRALLRDIGMPEAEFLELQRTRPGLIVADGEAVLIGRPRNGAINLQYGFPGHDAFARQFGPMLERLLRSVRPEEAPFGIRFRLTNRAPRPYVEPVLWANAFEQMREWWRMTLAALPPDLELRDDIAEGYRLRQPRAEDAETILRIEDAAFPMSTLNLPLLLDMIRSSPLYRVLEEAATGDIAAFVTGESQRPGEGYIGTLAVDPRYHRRGLGQALLRWSLAWFREQGYTSAALTVNTDNAPAIALYRKLGFEATDIGLDYRRPIDEDEVRQVLEKRRGAYIKVRKR